MILVTRTRPNLLFASLADTRFNSHASNILTDESGYKTESTSVSDFRASVLSGEWEKAESHLSNIPLNENACLEEALFLIREQKFLEALEDKDFTLALSILRTEISPLNFNTDKVHNLSRYCDCEK
jgi:WD repeat-containing protein 26